MKKRIFGSIFTVAMIVFLASTALIFGFLYKHFAEQEIEQLEIQTELAAQGMELGKENFFDDLNIGNYRITWVDESGEVLFDNVSDSLTMENHGERQEIKEAFETGSGESIRYSDTLMEKTIYCAKKLSDGTVIRLSVAHSSLLVIVLGMLGPLILVFAIAIAISYALASRLSQAIVEPLNKLDLDEPLSNAGYDELSPLLKRIDSQQYELKQRGEELVHKQEEFDAVTKSMNEGLVLLNNKGTILSINSAARGYLGTDKGCIGKKLIEVNRDPKLQEMLSNALEGNKTRHVFELSESKFEFAVNPVRSEEGVTGAVLLIFDVTDKENSEAIRREFTANVSHELKTPLHSISGYAELMSNGLVQQDDMSGFAGKIYSEAQRLICLVEDIIKLSRLDEGAEDMKREQLELLSMAESVKKSLEAEAKQANVEIIVDGTQAMIIGIHQLVNGIIYNLCDNAIKYNRPGGKVFLEIKEDGNSSVLTVKDTGIGIPPEHQNRIFERFYRVDKSHSKEVGGTGLGLSIVKHAAKVHNASIELHSVVNEGTKITVRFYKNFT